MRIPYELVRQRSPTSESNSIAFAGNLFPMGEFIALAVKMAPIS